MTKVAIEQGLKPFEDALKNAGFTVVEIREPSDVVAAAPHAVVISGMDRDFLGIDGGLKAPVISAAGRTPEEVVRRVRESLGPRE